jgi:hypothetical protein
MGDDIASACGQLVLDKKEMGGGNGCNEKDMEDLGKSTLAGSSGIGKKAVKNGKH